MMTDPIADMLTRIRNANAVKQESTSMPASKEKVGIAQVLKEEGFIAGYEVKPGKPSSELQINHQVISTSHQRSPWRADRGNA